MTTLDLSIIIPSYHEEDNLRVLLPRLHTVLQNLKIQYEILVIDTIEPIDQTKEVCEAFGAKYIPRKNGNFYGDAVRTGIQVASGKRMLFMDADGSHPPEFIENLWCEHASVNLIVASRYVKGGGSDNIAILKFMSRIVNLTFRIVLGLKCYDVSNSFKIYQSDEMKKLHLISNNFDIIQEILIKLIRNNPSFKIKEVPFFFRERMFGHTKRNLIAFMFSYLGTLIRLRMMR